MTVEFGNANSGRTRTFRVSKLLGKSATIALVAVFMLVILQPIIPSACAEEPLNILRIGSGESIDTANLMLGIYDISYVYYTLIWDSMLALNEDLTHKPNLAESWWSIDGATAASSGTSFTGGEFGTFTDPADWPKGSIWQYNLSENVFWSDKTLVTSEDVVWTINTQIGPNYNLYWAYQPYTRWISHAEEVDELAVRVFFKHFESNAPLPIAWGESLFVPVLPKHVFESYPISFLGQAWNGYDPFPVGTGPFIPTENLEKELLSGQLVNLVKNKYYDFVDDDGVRKGLGHARNITTDIDKIQLKFFTEETSLALAVSQGTVDVAKIQPDTYLKWERDREQGSLAKHLNLVNILTATGYSKQVVINAYEDAPGTFSPLRLDPAFQRAAALAINKTLIVEAVYKGLGVEGVGLISPVWEEWWWEPGNETSTFNVTGPAGEILFTYSKPMKDVMDYDPALANQILDAAGYVWTGAVGDSVRKAGPIAAARLEALLGIPQQSLLDNEEKLDFEIVIDSSVFEEREIGSNVINTWKDVGIYAYNDIVAAAVWSKRIYSYEFNTMVTYWSGDPDPNYISFPPTSYSLFGWNEFGTDFKEYDDLYLQQASALTYDERKGYIDEITKWQYLSGSIVTPVYPKICFAFNNKSWTGWGEWDEGPGMAVDNFWGANPLWFSLEPAESEPGDIIALIYMAGIGIAIIVAIAAVAIVRSRKIKREEEEMRIEDEET